MVNEEWAYVGQDEGEDASILWRAGYVAAIHEDILAATVSMEVSEDQHLSLLDKVVDHLLRMVDCRMQHFGRGLPSSIEITASQ